MPKTAVVFFRDEDGTVPLNDWFNALRNERAEAKCLERLEELAQSGHELRRPAADYLQDGIYELRAKQHRIQLRMFYFFHAGTAVVTHGCTKEDKIPRSELNLAVNRMAAFKRDPAKHSFGEASQ